MNCFEANYAKEQVNNATCFFGGPDNNMLKNGFDLDDELKI